MHFVKYVPRTGKARVLAVGAVAAAGAAAAVGGSALTASASQLAPAAAAPGCATSQLRVWLGTPGDVAAGTSYFQLELSNISAKTCTLYGYPGVSAAAAGGGQLGSAAGRDPADPKTLVTLGRGATAHAVVEIVDVANYPPSTCVPKPAVELKVYPPNTTTAAFVPLSFSACSKSGQVYLHVRTVVAGTGIPGFST